jgi:hypothetical protein
MQNNDDKETYELLERALRNGTLLDTIVDFMSVDIEPEIFVNGQAVPLAPGGTGGTTSDKTCYKDCFKKCLGATDHDKCYKDCTKKCKPKKTIEITIM